MKIFESTENKIHVAVLCPYRIQFMDWLKEKDDDVFSQAFHAGKVYFHVNRLRDVDGKKVDEYVCLRGGRGLKEHDQIMEYIERIKKEA